MYFFLFGFSLRLLGITYYIILFSICQEVFLTFFKFFFLEVLTSVPLNCISIIPQARANCNRQNAQIEGILGKNFCATFLQKTLDKLLKVWYNGEFGSLRPTTSRQGQVQEREREKISLSV